MEVWNVADLRKLLGMLGPYRRDLVLACLLIIVETSFELIIPTMMASLIDIGVANGDVGYMLHKGGQMALCAILALATGLAYARFAARAAYGWGARIREAEYSSLQSYAFSNIDKYETSSLVTRMTSDVTVMQNTINNGLRPLVRAPVMLVLGIVFSFSMNAQLALVFIILTPILGFVLFSIVRRVAPMYSILQKTVDGLNSVVEENLRAIRTVKAFVRGTFEEEKFDEVNDGLRSTATKTNATAVLNMPVFQTVMYFCVVCIMFFGGSMILLGRLQVGELTGFLSYVMQVLNSMMMLSNVFLLLTRSLASSSRICSVLDEEISMKEKDDPVEEIPSSSVEFDHVSFRYSAEAKEDTLSGITLSIAPGSTVGILGGTGSGKTTLVQLIDRLYDVDCGEVRVGPEFYPNVTRCVRCYIAVPRLRTTVTPYCTVIQGKGELQPRVRRGLPYVFISAVFPPVVVQSRRAAACASGFLGLKVHHHHVAYARYLILSFCEQPCARLSNPGSVAFIAFLLPPCVAVAVHHDIHVALRRVVYEYQPDPSGWQLLYCLRLLYGP